MKYLKIYTDFLMSLEPLGDAERGRLFVAMLEYVETNKEPDLRGNERFVWPSAKAQLDRTAREYQSKCQNGARGGRPRKTEENRNKPDETEINRSKPDETEWKQEKKRQRKDKDKEKSPPPSTPPKGGWGVPEGPLLDALRGFEEMRRKSRKPLTDRAKALLLGNLRKLSQDEATQVAILEQSILKGWQDVYALKGEPERPKETSYSLDKIKAAMMGGDWQ